MVTKTCVYDNPATLQRECYQNGKILYAYSHIIFLDTPKFQQELFFGANVGEWKEGQLIGDKEAMDRVEM